MVDAIWKADTDFCLAYHKRILIVGADIVCFVLTALIMVQISLILLSQTEARESPTLVRVK